jgi:hypothetical protein
MLYTTQPQKSSLENNSQIYGAQDLWRASQIPQEQTEAVHGASRGPLECSKAGSHACKGCDWYYTPMTGSHL